MNHRGEYSDGEKSNGGRVRGRLHTEILPARFYRPRIQREVVRLCREHKVSVFVCRSIFISIMPGAKLDEGQLQLRGKYYKFAAQLSEVLELTEKQIKVVKIKLQELEDQPSSRNPKRIQNLPGYVFELLVPQWNQSQNKTDAVSDEFLEWAKGRGIDSSINMSSVRTSFKRYGSAATAAQGKWINKLAREKEGRALLKRLSLDYIHR